MMNIRSTFALDPLTAQGLARLANKWGVSKSEALRRAVAQAQARLAGPGEMAPAQALAQLKRHPLLTKRQADAWIAGNAAARRRSDERARRRLPQAWRQSGERR